MSPRRSQRGRHRRDEGVRGHSTPFRPHWAGLKGFVAAATVTCAPDGREPARSLREPDRLRGRQCPTGPGARGRGAAGGAGARRCDRPRGLRPRRALRRRRVFRREREAHSRRTRAGGDARLGPAVARPPHPRPRRPRRSARRAGAARASRTPRRSRPGSRRARPPTDAEGELQDDRRPLDRLDALPFPTRSWAQVVYPDRAGRQALELLWQDVVHVCRLDEPDPARAWNERIDEIWQVASRLDALDLDALHFAGPGTDLTVGLLPSSRFAKEGGASHTRTGVRHVPNLPTEEVYTTPDPERTNGDVTATKPLDVAGSLVTGLRVRFEGGRAVEIDADTNADALRSAARRDDGGSASARSRSSTARAASASSAGRSSRHCSTRTPRVTSPSATRTPRRSATPTCRASTRARCTSTS